MLDDLLIADPSALSLERRLAMVEQQLMALLGVVHGIREEIEREADDGHIDP